MCTYFSGKQNFETFKFQFIAFFTRILVDFYEIFETHFKNVTSGLKRINLC
jgi:hypothetical protein